MGRMGECTPRVIKSHAPVELFLGSTDGKGIKNIIDSGAKIIVVSRNPLDACVSSYYHAFNPFKSGWPFEAWASAWLNSMFAHGSWFNFVKEWHIQAQLYPSSIHWVLYEDMQKNPRQAVQELGDFLNVAADIDLIDKVVIDSSFVSIN